MASVFTCSKCGASVTVDYGNPSIYGCRRTKDSGHSGHIWTKVGEVKPAATATTVEATTGTGAGGEFLQIILRLMFEGMANSNLPVLTRVLIASPIIALIVFVVYVLFSDGNTNAALTEPTQPSYEATASSDVQSVEPPMTQPSVEVTISSDAQTAEPEMNAALSRCVDQKVDDFRESMGEDVPITVPQLDEWESECKTQVGSNI